MTFYTPFAEGDAATPAYMNARFAEIQAAFDERVISASDYGALGDGVNDDTEALQAWLDALKISGTTIGQIGYLPLGTYLVSDSLVLDQYRGLRIFAASNYGTTLKWVGNDDTKALLRLIDCVQCTFEDLYFETTQVGAAAVALAAVSSENGGAGGVLNPTKCVFRNCRAYGTDGGFKYGWAFVEGDGGDNNNDLFSFYDCTASQCSEAGWYIGHSQSKEHRFYACGGNGGGKYVVHTVHGSFKWYGGNGGGTTVADFYFEDFAAADTIVIDGFDSELSARFVYFAGVSGLGYPITIRNCRFAAEGELHADGYAVYYQRIGPVILDNNALEGRLYLGATTVPLSASIRGCGFTDESGAADYNTPWDINTSGGGQIDIRANQFSNQSGIIQDLNLIRDGVNFIRAFPGGTFHTQNTSTTTYGTILNGYKGQQIALCVNDSFSAASHSTGTNGISLRGASSSSLSNGYAYSFVHNGTYWMEL